VIGSSTTQIFRNLSFALQLNPGEEIIVSKLDHEANIACWEQLASWKGLALKWWAPASVPVHNAQLDLGELESLLSAQTKLVTCTHASNLLGTINAIGEAAAIVHGTFPDARTMLCVDGVALAPHRPLDLPRLGADFYCFSWYKVYGPHIAMLYASPAAQAQMASLGHYFKPARTLEDKIGLAGASYELVQSIPAVVEYLGGSSREAREERWRGIIAHEAVLQKIILDFLKAREGVTIFGDERADAEVRVPVISFTVDGWTPDDIVKKVESRSKIGFRSGHMYSKRLCNDILGLPGDEGVVRVSLVHYNTGELPEPMSRQLLTRISEEEVKEFVKVLDDVFSGK